MPKLPSANLRDQPSSSLRGPRVSRGNQAEVLRFGEHSVTSKLSDGTMTDAKRLEGVAAVEKVQQVPTVDKAEAVRKARTAGVSDSASEKTIITAIESALLEDVDPEA